MNTFEPTINDYYIAKKADGKEQIFKYYYKGKNSKIIEKKKFWKIRKEKSKSNLLYPLLKKNIKEQLLGDVKIGASISGGLDSSIVASIANKNYKNLELFTGDFTEKNFSEFKISFLTRIIFNQIIWWTITKFSTVT